MARSNVQRGPMAAGAAVAERPRDARGHFLPDGMVEAEIVVQPAPKAPRTWVFYHAASVNFRWLLPEELRARTQFGYTEFRPDGISRDGTAVSRGKFVTSNREIAAALREAIKAGRLRQVWEDDAHLRLRCEYCDRTFQNNELGRRELHAHLQAEHDEE